MTISDHCGLFGKVPQQAEFVSHFLPDEFTEYWHSWLQASLSVSREQLGDQWLDYYLTSPIWCFAIMPGIMGPHGAAGIMLPSVDEVGRYFPLTLMHLGDHHVWSAYLHGTDWYQSLEQVGLNALSETVSYMQLIGQFESLSIPEFPEIMGYNLQSALHSTNTCYKVAQGEHTTQSLVFSLLNDIYQRSFNRYSLWWTKGSEYIDPCLLVSSDLPDAGQFAAMLDGRWQQWGWPEQLPLLKES